MQGNLNDKPASEDIHRYAAPGNVRNICFAWPDGRMQYFNYAYLVTSEYLPEEALIQLEFTTHSVTIKGIDLQPLYFEIYDQHARIVVCVDKRYSQLANDKTVVEEIIITSHD